ncbi:Uncharacterised protein [Pseudomonas putida]|nr:Uncharacterised protein [Pseudomonas putida]
MAETAKQMVAYQVEYVCDSCGEGHMRPAGITLTSYPAQYPHQCSACGARANFLKCYPSIEWRAAPQN